MGWGGPLFQSPVSLYEEEGRPCEAGAQTGATRPQTKRRRGLRVAPEATEPNPDNTGFRLLASRTVREHISVALGHPVCGPLNRQRRETSMEGEEGQKT